MNIQQQLPELAQQVSSELMNTVRSLSDIPLGKGETLSVRESMINKVAYREFAYINELKRAVREFQDKGSKELEEAAINLLTICNDHQVYLSAMINGHSRFQSFKQFVEKHNSFKNAVYIGQVDNALIFLSAIAPYFHRQSAAEQRPEDISTLIDNIRHETIERLITEPGVPHADLALLKAVVVMYSSNSAEAVEAVESRRLPKTFVGINWGYCRNALAGLYEEWEGNVS